MLFLFLLQVLCLEFGYTLELWVVRTFFKGLEGMVHKVLRWVTVVRILFTWNDTWGKTFLLFSYFSRLWFDDRISALLFLSIWRLAPLDLILWFHKLRDESYRLFISIPISEWVIFFALPKHILINLALNSFLSNILEGTWTPLFLCKNISLFLDCQLIPIKKAVIYCHLSTISVESSLIKRWLQDIDSWQCVLIIYWWTIAWALRGWFYLFVEGSSLVRWLKRWFLQSRI